MGKPTKFKSPPLHRVFINSHGGDLLRDGFVHEIGKALRSIKVNAYADEPTGEEVVFKRIEKSRIAIVVFSSRYTESRWCLEELVKIKEGMEQGKLEVIPIFYKLDTCAELEGGSGLNLLNPTMRGFDPGKVKIWNEALDSVSCMMGYHLYNNSDESKFISRIVKDVRRILIQVPKAEQLNDSHDSLSEQKKDESVLGEAESVKDDIFLCEANEKVEAVNDEEVSTSSTLLTSYKYKMFINFRGIDLHDGFVGHIVEALERVGFNVYVDEDELQPGDLSEPLFKRIEESRIAIVIFSSRYTESTWCLDKLVKIKERMDAGKLLIIPIFYKLKQLQVTQLEGSFGIRIWNFWRSRREYRVIKWKEALECVGGLKGLVIEEDRLESELITSIVKDIEKKIEISLQERKNQSSFSFTGREENTELPTGKGKKLETYLNHRLFGIELRMEQLEQKLEFDRDETRIIGVVGMPGIGKTTLAMRLYEEWNSKFVHCMPLLGICKKSKDHELVWLRKTLLEVLLEGKFPEKQKEITHESVKDILLQTKVFIVLTDVSDRKQLDFLLGNLDWVKKGSKIVITTGDRSLLKEFVDDIYVVPLLNDEEAFQLFTYHAFDDQTYSPSQGFVILSRKFVDYAQGHPQALISLGTELRGKDEDYWKQRLTTVTGRDNATIQDVWKFSTDQLNERQKDVFLDIVHFFKSEDEYFVRSLLDSGDPDATDAVSEVRDLADKFLITVSDGKVEMNDLLYRFGKGLGSPWLHRMWSYKDTYTETGTNSMRGIFLDMSGETKSFPLERMTFTNMQNLRYLKIYNSYCSRQCKAKCKLHLPDGLSLPLEEIRYFHFINFPLEQLPPDFRPENLIDLRLPYSKIQRIWEDVKDTPRLKWVDLCHSNQLFDLSALSKAENLQRLNLEGCTALEELPVEIQNMKSLVFLNLRGCIRLWSLPNINLISLKTLILSGCSNLKDFQLISESLEFLHLDGTSITGLPLAIQSLQRLVVLNLKNCEMLEGLPNCLGELKALEELILSGCSRLKNVSDVRESMKHLQSLLIDRIGAKEMPNITISKGQASADKFIHGPSGWLQGVNGVFSLRRLSLSGNDFVSLQTDIWKLYNLNWLDVKDCKKLRSIPMLPPRLEYFDAHGCDSLERVSHPLALPVRLEQIHAKLNFSNCSKLDQDAKDSIVSYTRWRSELVLDALSRYNNGDSALGNFTGTCFPGWEVPARFSHKASGPVLEGKLSPHWRDNNFTGIALCAVVLFPDYHEQRARLVVKCNCEFNNEDGSYIRFSCTIGSWSDPGKTAGKIVPSHVFIGYASMLDNKKLGDEESEKGCSPTKTHFKFQVTDGTEVLHGYEVLKCGFSLVYASDELRVQSSIHGANHYGAYSKNVTISNVRREKETMNRRLDGGHDIVELPNKMISHGIASTPKRPNNKSPVTILKQIGRETQVRALSVRFTGKPRVYISCHGGDLCITFVKHLVNNLTNAGVKVFIDNDERMWIKMNQLYNRIEDSRIAVVIFSKRYLASGLCLNELAKMDELAKEGKLLVIPVFYQVISSDMKNLKGECGRCFREMRKRHEDEPNNVRKWETSLMSMAETIGVHSEIHGIDAALVKATVKAVHREITKIAGGKFKSLGRGFMLRARVFIFALFAALLFSLFVSPLIFTDATFAAF